MTRALLMTALLLSGCVATPREQLPAVDWRSEADALRILADRAQQLKTVSAQGLMTMRRPDGQSVRLDIAIAGDSDHHLRLRAWKLGRAVFDLTMNRDGVWMLLPDDPSIRKKSSEGQLNLKRLADSWDLFNGRFFARSDLAVRDSGRTLICSATIDGSRVRCDVDKTTLTPRRYIMSDPDGVERFSLSLSQFKQISGIPFAQRYSAGSDMGDVIISLHDVELNAELAEGAFIPPRRAEKLK